MILTFDMDWAPDFVVEDIIKRLTRHHVKATWFVTNASESLEHLRKLPELFELGIHPNFSEHSSHGSSIEEVLTNMTKLVPEAVSTRSHQVFQSGPLLKLLVEHKTILIDSTLYLPEMPGIRPVKLQFGNCTLIRIPIFWADDHEMVKPNPSFDLKSLEIKSGLRVLLFHPIHAYLNSETPELYAHLRRKFGSISEWREPDISPYIHEGEGTGTLLDQCIRTLGQSGDSRTLKDLVEFSDE